MTPEQHRIVERIRTRRVCAENALVLDGYAEVLLALVTAQAEEIERLSTERSRLGWT